MTFFLLLGLVVPEELPRALAAQEPPVVEPVPAARASLPFICLDRPEIELRAGLVAFSSDFESDPQASASLLVRSALPWLSRDVLGFCPDHLGVFVQLTASRLERELEPSLPDSDGSIFFAGAGLDYTLVHGEHVQARLEGGAMVGRFGDVEGAEDGVAGLVGLRVGIRLTGDVWVTVSPQAAFGEDEAQVYFLHVGLRLRF